MFKNIKPSSDSAEYCINHDFNDSKNSKCNHGHVHCDYYQKLFRSIDQLEKSVKLMNAASGVLLDEEKETIVHDFECNKDNVFL